jgi:hypothetical protein
MTSLIRTRVPINADSTTGAKASTGFSRVTGLAIIDRRTAETLGGAGAIGLMAITPAPTSVAAATNGERTAVCMWSL